MYGNVPVGSGTMPASHILEQQNMSLTVPLMAHESLLMVANEIESPRMPKLHAMGPTITRGSMPRSPRYTEA